MIIRDWFAKTLDGAIGHCIVYEAFINRPWCFYGATIGGGYGIFSDLRV